MFGNYRRRRAGQSIVLLALLMVFIVGCVGLSVDVGNAYGQQRRMQSAANAGALGGMNAWLAYRGKSTGWTNEKVWRSVQQSLAGNRVEIDKGQYTYTASYIKIGNPTPIALAEWNGTTETIYNKTDQPPTDVDRIRIKVTNRVETFFARIVHRNTFTVNGMGDACLGSFGLGFMPIGIPSPLVFDKEIKENKESNGKDKGGGPKKPEYERYHRIFEKYDDVDKDNKIEAGEYTEDTNPNSATWQAIKNHEWMPLMENKYLYIPIRNLTDGLPGAHVAWLDWTGPGGGGANELKQALDWPGNLQNVTFTEGTDLNASLPDPTPPIPNQFQLYDWVSGEVGTKAGTEDNISQLITDKREVLLPMYDAADKDGGTSYHIRYVGRFKIIAAKFNGKETGPIPPAPDSASGKYTTDIDGKYLVVQYLGDHSNGTANSCTVSQ